MSRIVQYSENGGLDRLRVSEGETPEAGPGEVRVRVLYAGLNPVDWKILSGAFGPVEGTAGNGADFSGVVDQVGDGVEGFSPGDLVFGGHIAGAQAEHIVVGRPARRLHRVPRGLGIDAAGGLNIAGRTAIAGIRAIAPAQGETVYISGASGGVGIIAAQLALNLGARVIGGASEANHALLRSLGIEPLAYGEGLEQRLRDAAPEGLHAAYSTQDQAEVELLLSLDVPADRINAIGAGPQVAEDRGVRVDGTANARPEDLDWLAQAIAYGHLHLPVARVFALEEVREAYRFLREAHPAGKVLLRLEAAPLTEEQRRSLTS
ncbi:NADP-dependent oxidoreductase [Leucobacter sp. wl10]|uniref:NADP-dependent oxidoreductase n=1 Tax=Leucobacter sp. wl10 TaxID=2304677 RepID=UPI000E5A6A47|nr:NADP-dependent oxidoreductase [Leucobacter sp. wl10]RGE19758.1 NADP-dependent oxidoreductase [Leucobacter sp. wl10]